LPNLSNYTVITPAAHGVSPDLSMILLATAYALVYCSVLLIAATLIFGRRNLK